MPRASRTSRRPDEGRWVAGFGRGWTAGFGGSTRSRTHSPTAAPGGVTATATPTAATSTAIGARRRSRAGLGSGAVERTTAHARCDGLRQPGRGDLAARGPRADEVDGAVDDDPVQPR